MRTHHVAAMPPVTWSVVAVLAAVVLAGCGTAADPGAPSGPVTPTGPPTPAPPTVSATSPRPNTSSPSSSVPARPPTGSGDERDADVGALGTMVATWTETSDPGDAVESLPERALLATDAQREQVVAPVADALDVADVMAVDLDRSVLVLVSYADCNLRSRVVAGSSPGTLHTLVERVVADNTQCVWAPLTVDVWEVPHAALGGADPATVQLRDR